MGGGGGRHIFPNLKRGDHVFFQSLILNVILKKVCNPRNGDSRVKRAEMIVGKISIEPLKRYQFGCGLS